MENKEKKIIGKASNGQLLHFSAGAVIERGGKYLMIDRVSPPFGYAGLAGHIDEGESPEQTVIREVSEESGLKVAKCELLFEEEILWNYCKSAPAHKWYLFECEVEGDATQNKEEEKAMGWYTKEELERLPLEPMWRYWFEKLGIISTRHKITLCGSMKFFDEMEQMKKVLEEKGFVVDMPERFLAKQEDDNDAYKDLNNPIWQLKHNAIQAHFRKILWADAILVLNYEKNDIAGYVGGNTLMEIGFAAWHSKKIYFLNDIPENVSYREELFASKPTILNGDLSNIN